MFISKIRGHFSLDLLIEIRENILTVKAFSSDSKFEEAPLVAVETINGKQIARKIGTQASHVSAPNITVINPFSHPRSMISNFSLAQHVIKYAIEKVHETKVQPAPRVIMHQLEKNVGGFTEIEERVLNELAYGAGAREVLIYSGTQINPQAETYDGIKNRIGIK